MNHPSDEELMLEVKKGDVGAFEQLVGRYERPIIAFFFRQSWDRQLAEDLAQEVFLRIYKARKDYEPRAKFRTYFYHIARNLWIDKIRSKRKAGREVSLQQPLGEDGESASLQSNIEGKAPKPSAEMRREDMRSEIRSALSFLPDEQRSVFILCEIEGMKYADVAEMLGIPVGTVKSRMHTATAKLRSRLKKRPGADPT